MYLKWLGGDRIRTCNLQVMRPMSWPIPLPRFFPLSSSSCPYLFFLDRPHQIYTQPLRFRSMSKSLEILVNASFLRGMKCVGWVILQRLLAKKKISRILWKTFGNSPSPKTFPLHLLLLIIGWIWFTSFTTRSYSFAKSFFMHNSLFWFNSSLLSYTGYSHSDSISSPTTAATDRRPRVRHTGNLPKARGKGGRAYEILYMIPHTRPPLRKGPSTPTVAAVHNTYIPLLESRVKSLAKTDITPTADEIASVRVRPATSMATVRKGTLRQSRRKYKQGNYIMKERSCAFLSYSIDLLCYDEMNLHLPHSFHEIPLILCHLLP